MDTTKPTSAITGYHAHIYFTPESMDAALVLQAILKDKMPHLRYGRVHQGPVGPHPMGMYQIAFAVEDFDTLVPYLMLNRSGLNILVHPETGDDLTDHTAHALWLGEKLPLNVDMFK